MREVPGLPVRTLEVIGEDFRAVEEVIVNGYPSPSYVNVSDKKILVQVPDEAALQRITSVEVLSNNFVLSPRSKLRFKLNKQPRRCNRMLLLVQMFLKILLTTPGRDRFAKKIGGGLMRNIGAVFSKNNGGSILADVIITVDQTTKQLLALQRTQNLAPEEKLLTAKVESAYFSKTDGGLVVQINLKNQAGKTGYLNVEI